MSGKPKVWSDAEVLAGSTYLCFDNVRGYVGSQSLEGLMTSPDWTGRVLGKTNRACKEASNDHHQ